jgi:small subunit ribosomal protein S2
MSFSGSLQDAGDTIGWTWYLLLVLVVLALILGWIYQQSKKQSKEVEKKAESRETESSKREVREDDLTRIEGIGPKVDKILKRAGIKSFDDLSSADPAEVKSVLNEAGLQMMSPEGWVEQAQLAAEEDWEGLQKLQGEMKGSRRK